MYGEGKAETLVGKAIKGYNRDKLFLVSKVYPWNAGKKHIFQSCNNSLSRLNTEYLDLYLLHWRGRISLEETIECMERLVAMGKIRRWGVSNFDISDMQELWATPGGSNCAVNQVLYHVASRGIEYSLLPWMSGHSLPLMAYCPLAQAGELRTNIFQNPRLREIASSHRTGVAEIMLAFVVRHRNIIAIPRSENPEHTKANAKASEIVLTDEEIALINHEFPRPSKKHPLDIV